MIVRRSDFVTGCVGGNHVIDVEDDADDSRDGDGDGAFGGSDLALVMVVMMML